MALRYCAGTSLAPMEVWQHGGVEASVAAHPKTAAISPSGRSEQSGQSESQARGGGGAAARRHLHQRAQGVPPVPHQGGARRTRQAGQGRKQGGRETRQRAPTRSHRPLVGAAAIRPEQDHLRHVVGRAGRGLRRHRHLAAVHHANLPEWPGRPRACQPRSRARRAVAGVLVDYAHHHRQIRVHRHAH